MARLVWVYQQQNEGPEKSLYICVWVCNFSFRLAVLETTDLSDVETFVKAVGVFI
jgi:hypothetical protein